MLPIIPFPMFKEKKYIRNEHFLSGSWNSTGWGGESTCLACIFQFTEITFGLLSPGTSQVDPECPACTRMPCANLR